MIQLVPAYEEESKRRERLRAGTEQAGIDRFTTMNAHSIEAGRPCGPIKVSRVIASEYQVIDSGVFRLLGARTLRGVTSTVLSRH